MLDTAFMVKSLPLFEKALLLTLEISILGIFFAILVGLFSAVMIFYKVPILSKIAQVYVAIARNTPLLIQLFFLYYGLVQVGLKIPSFACAVIGLSFLGGGYMSESFRSALQSVPKTQVESAVSLGFTTTQVLRLVIIPQTISVAMPSIGANTIFLLKETSVVSAIALADIMFVAKDLIGSYYKTSEALILLTLSYLVVLLPLSILFRCLEIHYKKTL